MIRFIRNSLFSSLMVLTCAAAVAQSSAYPSKPIRLVVPYGPGGPSDIVARVIADEMSRSLGQPLVIDNKPGAGSMVGTEIVVRSPADGYTLLLTDLPVTIVPHVLKASAKYNPVKDLEAIGLIGGSSLGFVVPDALPAKTLAEFVTLARSRPEGMRIGSGGNGSLTHLMAEVFAQSAGFKLTHLPYLGTGPAIPDLLAGRLDGLFNSYLATKPYLDGGKLRMLAIASDHRVPEFPSATTFAEAGYRDVTVDYWLGIAGPSGTPKAVVDRVRSALDKALQSSGVQEKFTALAITKATDTSGPALTRAIQAEYKRWGEVVKTRNITVN
ncbi:MAG: tripartite tricarboxylate transporter substrate binding protein [Comamonadaceae bacterium]|nr:tripartite tricarboxylate transporter substrate binding protein [Comamonadaceae bacterium]